MGALGDLIGLVFDGRYLLRLFCSLSSLSIRGYAMEHLYADYPGPPWMYPGLTSANPWPHHCTMYQTGQSGRRIHDRCSRLLDAPTVPLLFQAWADPGWQTDRQEDRTNYASLLDPSRPKPCLESPLEETPRTPYDAPGTAPGLPPQARGGSPSPARVSREGISAADPDSGLDRCFLPLPWRILLQGRGGARLVYLRPFLNNTLGLWPEHSVRHRV